MSQLEWTKVPFPHTSPETFVINQLPRAQASLSLSLTCDTKGECRAGQEENVVAQLETASEVVKLGNIHRGHFSMPFLVFVMNELAPREITALNQSHGHLQLCSRPPQL